MSDTWQTYAQAAKILGLTIEGVRQRARREMWRKQLGNDGKARIIIPADTTAPPPDDTGDNQQVDKLPPKRLPAGPTAGEVAALQARIMDLQDELSRSRQDADRERDERRQERDRADRLADDLTEMAKRLADAATLKDETVDQIAELTSELARLRRDAEEARASVAAFRELPWWRRLVG